MKEDFLHYIWQHQYFQKVDLATTAGKPLQVKEDYFIYQPPRSIWGYGSGSVSDRGAIWLEVTYAKGLKRGGGPIEEVKQVR